MRYTGSPLDSPRSACSAPSHSQFQFISKGYVRICPLKLLPVYVDFIDIIVGDCVAGLNLLLGRIPVLCTQMRPIVTDRVVWSVGLSVGL